MSHKAIYACNDLSSLREIIPDENVTDILVSNHTKDSHVGGGFFYYDPADSTSTDDNGMTIVTKNGDRWKRRFENEICLSYFGLTSGGAIDGPLKAAIKFCQKNGVGNISIPPSSKQYILDGGININMLNGGICIHGSSTGKSANVKIKHTGDNVGITFGGRNLWVAGGVYDIEVAGNEGVNAAFVEFQDSWGFEFKNCFGREYTNGTLIILRNKKAWTEGAVIENVMGRNCKQTVALLRDSASGGFNSFYGTSISRLYHQGAVGNSSGIIIGDGTQENSVKLYASKVDIGGWNENGGGHATVRVTQYSEFSNSLCTNRNDGFAMDSWSLGNWQVRVSENAFCDIEYKQNGSQLSRLDVTSMPDTFGLFSMIASQVKVYAAKGSRPTIRLKGASIKFGQAEFKGSRKIIIKDLPPYTSWELKLNSVGANLVRSDTYAIEVLDGNLIAHVKSLTQQNNTNFVVQTLNESLGGSFSLGKGLMVQITLDASEYPNGVDWTGQLTMK